SLFGSSSTMADLFGVMLNVPQIAESLKEVGGIGLDNIHLSRITKDWVNGRSLTEIADAYFADDTNDTKKLTAACRAIYRSIVNSGTWGISALSRLSGMNFDNLPEADRRRINLLPAMIYHGVRTENAVLMRMNSVPRSASENIGELFRETWIAEG